MNTAELDAPAFVHLAAHPVRWRVMVELARSDLRVRELVALTGEAQNLISYHLRLLREAQLVTARRSSLDGRDSYCHLDLDRCAAALTDAGLVLHPALAAESKMQVTPAQLRRSPRLSVLFVCSGNSARSPIAEALLRHHSDGEVTVVSAGTVPKPEVHFDAVDILHEEYGIDTGNLRTRHVNTVARRRFDAVVTMCDKAREVCPEVDGDPFVIHWSIADPLAPQPDGSSVLSEVAADIDLRVRHLLPVLAAMRTRSK